MHLHRWEVKEKEVHPSAYEQMASSDFSMNNLTTEGYGLFERTVIVHLKCKKCALEKVERI